MLKNAFVSGLFCVLLLLTAPPMASAQPPPPPPPCPGKDVDGVCMVDQVRVQVGTKHTDECKRSLGAFFWIARDRLAPLGMEQCTSGLLCGKFSFNDRDYTLGQINPTDGDDACGLCDGCGLAYVALAMGAMPLTGVTVGDTIWAHYCPQGLTCEGVPPLLGGGPAVPLLGGVLLCAALYGGGGFVLGQGRHPHAEKWRELAGLVTDGVAYARSGGTGRNGCGYAPIDRAPPPEVESGTAKQPRKIKRSGSHKHGKSKRGKRSSSKSTSDRSTQENAAKRSKSDADQELAPAPGEVAAAKARILAEQTEELGVHSSQAKVKVVSLSS
eukprot:COSAG02_NODE_1426_length_12664_cov_6.226980_8_plen_327_part_00